MRVVFKRLVHASWDENTYDNVTVDLDEDEGMLEALRVLQQYRPFVWRKFVTEDADLEPSRRAAAEQIGFEHERRLMLIADKAAATMEARQAKAWPMEKQRGSRVEWGGLLPAGIANRQIAWERSRTAARLMKVGLPLAECADLFGVSSRRFKWLAARHGPVSPAEQYLSVANG